MELHFAPLQGYADHIYRRLHAEIFGGVDFYYTPFIRVEKGEPRRQDMTRLRSCVGDGTSLVPQIIFNSADEFSLLSQAVKDLGFKRVDLNLGCPYPMQTKKGRGAAMISRLDVMAEVAERIKADTDAKYSIKMRLGMDNCDEWRGLLPVLNSLELAHITVHPRIAKQMYSGEIAPDKFGEFLAESKNHLVWNGDILTIEGIDALQREFPAIKGVMVGRGMLARPSLAEEWRNGAELAAEERLEKILRLHDRLFDEYKQTLCGQAQILQKIKPFWEYLQPEIGRKPFKAIHKATSLDRYISAVAQI